VAVFLGVCVAGGGAYSVWRAKTSTVTPVKTWKLTTEKLSLRWQIGHPDLATAEVGVVGADAGEEFIASSETPWLNLVSTQVLAPEAFRAVLSPGKLEPGTYQGRMVVKNTEGTRTRSVLVELVELPRAVNSEKTEQTESSIRGDVAEVQFQVRRGDASADAKSVKVTGAGVTAFRVSIPLGADWVTVDRPDGLLPATLLIRPKAAGLGVGQHTGMVQIASAQNPTVVTRVNVKIRVEEFAKPVDPPPITKPPVTEPKPEPPPNKPLDRTQYSGALSGTISWFGDLAPGQKLTLGPTGVMDGGGRVSRGKLPGEIAVVLDVKPPTVLVESPPAADNSYGRMVLVNKGATAVRSIEIRWNIK